MDLSYEPFTEYVPPTWDRLFMEGVYWIAAKSKDPRTKVGAVVVRDNRPILWGYNGIVKGAKDLPERMERPTKYKWMAHAERNCCYQAAKLGPTAEGATMYTQGVPCTDCAIGVIQSGIKEIVVHGPWMEYETHFDNKKERPQWDGVFSLSRDMLTEAGVTIRTYTEILGKVGYLNGYKVLI